MQDILENALIDLLLRGQAYAPAGIYVGLFTTAPTDAAPGTEPAGGGYARANAGRALTAWTATQGGTAGVSSGTGGQSGNAADVVFPSPSGAWGTVTHFGLFDAASGGACLFAAALDAPKTINAGDGAPKFVAGALTVTLT